MRRVAFILFALTTLTATAEAQDRSTSRRARMELAFDHGIGFSTSGEYLEVAADLRLWLPENVGFVLRGGAGLRPFGMFAGVQLGVAYRLDLVREEHVGLQWVTAVGGTLGTADVDHLQRGAFGGWAMTHLDFWHRNAFVGLGVVAHALALDGGNIVGPHQPTTNELLAVTPMIRIGGEWGL
jgi:hypothetical protein